jgi:hypothetical protein
MHGHPSQAERLIVHSANAEKFFTLTRTNKLCSTFRKRLNLALEKSARVVIIICAHGFEENGGYVLLGRVKFHRSELEMIIPSRLVGGAVTLLSTACHSGLFVSPRWTAFCAVPGHRESLSFSRYSSLRNRGGAWTGAFAMTAYTHGDRLADDFGSALQKATMDIKPSHAIPVHLICDDDEYRNAASIIAAEALISPPIPPVPRDTGDAHRTAGRTAGRLDTLVTTYLSSNYPNPDAPANHYIHNLLALYEEGRATAPECLSLANALRQRQGDDATAMEIIGSLGIMPDVTIGDWPEDEDLALHQLFPLVHPLVHKYQGFAYRKPMLFVVWACGREGVSEQRLRHVLGELQQDKAVRRRRRRA